MKTQRVAPTLAAALGPLLGLALAATAHAAPLPDSFSALVEHVQPAVVTIATTELQAPEEEEVAQATPGAPRGSPLEKFFNDRLKRKRPQPTLRLTALGSGFIIDAAGIVVTNNHVVGNGVDIRVTLHDGTVLPATVLGSDEQTDIAVLRIEPAKPLMAVELANSDTAKVGDWVIAVGNPFGLGGTVTAGIISARQRDIHAGPTDDFLQIDASINQGNSGGPTFDLHGVGIGFAIPANLAKPVIAQLRASGRVTRGWLGVQIQALTPELVGALGLAGPQGALVTEVSPKSPAAAAGLQAGDVIQSFDGKPVDALRELTGAVARGAVGSTIALQLVRDGKTVPASVTLGELKRDEPQRPRAVARAPAPSGAAGLKLSALSSSVRQRFGIPGQIQGVLVTGVAETSAAAELGLQPGDVIEQVNGRKVGAPKDVTAAITAAGKTGRKAVALLVNRQGQKEFVALPVVDG